MNDTAFPSPAEPSRTPYDVVAYPGYCHPQTHPDRLAALGNLFGLNPAPPSRCRVLELGCGNGTNLIPMAAPLPNSEFIGIDLAASRIAEGQQMIRDLNLPNIRLVHGNVAGVGGDWGKFDYVIAHGLFSWVPPDVRDSVLRLCRQSLAPQGIAFISYNALPGGHLRNMLREMLRFHVRGFPSPDERVKQAIALASFLANSQGPRDEYRAWMTTELERIRNFEPGHLYHDDLAEVNQPFYFTQFIEHAGRHGLQFLAEADFFEMSDHFLAEPIRSTLAQLGQNRILREQYLDFIKCRRFRQTLLCHQEQTVPTDAQPERVTGLYVGLAAEPVTRSVDLHPGAHAVFETDKGARIETDFVAGKAALMELAAVWPLRLAFTELYARLTHRLQSAQLEAHAVPAADLCAFLLRLCAANLVEFRAGPPTFTTTISARPCVSPLARWQIQRGNCVTSQFHLPVKVEDEVGRHLLLWLDGTVDQPALLERLWQLLKSKNALVLPDGSETAARRKLELDLKDNLHKLARMGLLIG